MLNDSGAEVAQHNLHNHWPTKYQGPSLNAKASRRAKESITIAWETLELELK